MQDAARRSAAAGRRQQRPSVDLPEPRLADDAERLALAHGEADVVDRAHELAALARRKRDLELVDGQDFASRPSSRQSQRRRPAAAHMAASPLVDQFLRLRARPPRHGCSAARTGSRPASRARRARVRESTAAATCAGLTAAARRAGRPYRDETAATGCRRPVHPRPPVRHTWSACARSFRPRGRGCG